jgi:3-phosphoshikimate 1-carboxyvinyltransferase
LNNPTQVCEIISPARLRIYGAKSLRGEITVPGDKSISHRAVIFNAIANGAARVTNFLPGEDCLSSIACMRALGVHIELNEQARTVNIYGKGIGGLAESSSVLDAGNSGTTMRLLTGLLSGQNFYTVLTGDSSLRNRPMGRVIEPLRRMGAQIWGRKGDTLAPISLKGSALKGIEYSLPVASAQLKSCLLLAALYANGATRLTGLINSRDHTERMLKAMGASLSVTEEEIALEGPVKELVAQNVSVPGDISSAAFWLVAATVHPDADLTLLNVGVNPTRTGIIDTLSEMGADITLMRPREIAGEPVADLRVKSSRLVGGTVGGAIIPRLVDEIPALAIAAAFAKGQTRISDAAELRVKESDRIATVSSELGRIGASVEPLPDGMIVQGPATLKSGQTRSYGDHRLAMALAVVGLALPTGESLELEDFRCADVSYPGFWEDLVRVAKI